MLTPDHNSTKNCDPGSLSNVNFDVSKNDSHNFMLNCVPIPSWIVTRVNHLPGLQLKVKLWSGSYLNVTFEPIFISYDGIVTHGGVKIQQHARNSTTKEGHNSPKLNIEPGSLFNGEVQKELPWVNRTYDPVEDQTSQHLSFLPILLDFAVFLSNLIKPSFYWIHSL